LVKPFRQINEETTETPKPLGETFKQFRPPNLTQEPKSMLPTPSLSQPYYASNEDDVKKEDNLDMFDDLLNETKIKKTSGSSVDFSDESVGSVISEPYSGGSSPATLKPAMDTYVKKPKESRVEKVVEKEEPQYLNEDDERLDLLLKLKSLEQRKGVVLSKHFTTKSPVEELRLEYKNQTRMLESESSVKFMSNGLIFLISGIEFFNRKYDPIGAKLDGWSESIMENIMDYHGIFERLHDKYKGSVEMEPEVELVWALISSAIMFHLSKTLFSSAVPQFDNVLRERPGLVKEIFGAATEAAKRQQAQENIQKTGPMPSNMFMSSGDGGGGLGGVDFGSMMSSLGGGGGIDSILKSVFPNMTGLNTDALPKPMNTRKAKEPPLNDLYRQMVKEDEKILPEETTKSSGNKIKISSSPKGNVIKI
jgi:hypothetical protein